MTAGDTGREAYTAIAWGVGLSRERSDIAGAEGFYSLEGNMCGTAMRGVVALPGSKATSRAKGSHPDDKERWMWLSREWLKLAQDPGRQNLPPEDERGIRRVKTD